MLRLSSQPRKSDGETPPPTTPHATGAMECLLGPCAGPGHGGIERYAAEVTLHSVEVRVASRRVAVICAFGSVFYPPRAFSHPSPRRGTRPRRSHRPHLTRVPLLAQGLERDVGGFLDGEDAVFVRIRWSGSSRASSSSSSYFRRVPIDDTSRARARSGRVRLLDSLDFHETFVHTRCDMIRAGDARERSGATVAVADLARLDDLAHLDDPARVDEGNPVFSRGRCACPSARSPTTPNPARRAGNYARGFSTSRVSRVATPTPPPPPRSSGSRTAPARPWTSACDPPPVRSDPRRRATRTRATSSRRARRKIPSRARRPPRRSFRSFLHPRRRLARARRHARG